MGLFSSLQAVLLHSPLVFTNSDIIKTSQIYSKAYENTIFLCKKEKVKVGTCLVNRLRCYYRKDCGREYMLMKLICSVSSNQSSHAPEYPDCQEGGNEASLLVSPLVVAGIVIGLVLFLSCVTIIVGSLRKDSRLRNPHLRASYAPDGLSYGGSIGELRSTCVEDFPPAFDFDSYVETLSQVNVMYPDSPPHYDECVGQGTQIYVPTDDPPPYSLTDPCRDQYMEDLPAGASWVSASGSSRYPSRLQNFRHQPVASISLSALPLDEAPPYEAVMSEQNQPLPLMPLDLLKHTTADSSAQDSVSHRIL
ncbi:protein BEAN1 isoform X1 [Danio rerio]|uniref:Brain-expressed,-associated with NEDD4, 1 n=1 Tax=Danio rerio TaxID=7955 RepID=E7F6F0_DANRE|nr:protein BEAN1 isoform X1 [Danio rerio]|eukprot:XP_005166509.1 protein BEAN1 isoform X1 [Danio rerio]